MQPGIAKVGQKVKLIKPLHSYPEMTGTSGVIIDVVAQNPGAHDDAILYHPEGIGWAEDEVVPVLASDVELIESLMIGEHRSKRRRTRRPRNSHYRGFFRRVSFYELGKQKQ
jgi:hypothetical protein